MLLETTNLHNPLACHMDGDNSSGTLGACTFMRAALKDGHG